MRYVAPLIRIGPARLTRVVCLSQVLYFFFYLPISFSFIKYGRQISRELLKMKGSLSKLEAAKRKRFARRVVQSGVLGFAIDLASLFIVFTNGISITVSIVGYTINLILMAIAGALHVLVWCPKVAPLHEC